MAQAKNKGVESVTCDKSAVPSSTKSRFAPLISGKTPGTLLSQEEIAASVSGARAWKVRYISKDVNGVLNEVSVRYVPGQDIVDVHQLRALRAVDRESDIEHLVDQGDAERFPRRAEDGDQAG
jgi:hypothetical protein